jgi:hypothetical protein
VLIKAPAQVVELMPAPRHTCTLAIAFNFAGDHVALNEWYNREHVPERVGAIDGFIRGRRFVALAGAPQYLTLYDLRDASVLSSPDYVAMLARPDPRTREFTAQFTDVAKTVLKTKATSGIASGAFLRVVVFDGEIPEPRGADLLTALLSRDGIVAVHWLAADAAVMNNMQRIPTRQGDGVWPNALLAEGVSEHALRALDPAAALKAHASSGAGTKTITDGLYSLTMQKP